MHVGTPAWAINYIKLNTYGVCLGNKQLMVYYFYRSYFRFDNT